MIIAEKHPFGCAYFDKLVFPRPHFEVPPKVKALAARISPIAIEVIVKLSLAIAINLAVITFVALPFSIPMSMALLSEGLILSTLYAIPKVAYDIYRNHQTDEPLFQDIKHLANFSIMNTLGLAGLNQWIHESGHALAALALFKNPQVQITVKPWGNAATDYFVSNGMTKVGRIFGKQNGILFVTSAGMMASTIFGMVEMACAYKLKEQYPHLSQWMNYHAISQILNDVIYGLTAFVTSHRQLSHDFIRLWQMGQIHPLIPIGLMIALPLIELGIIYLLERRKQSQAIQVVANSHLTPDCALIHSQSLKPVYQ